MTTLVRQCIGAYALPNIQASYDDLARIVHRDLARMSDRMLFAELTAASAALALGVQYECNIFIEVTNPPYLTNALDWLEARIAACDAEIRDRRRAGVRS